MAQNTAPIFVLTPVFGVGTVITAANTNLDGTGTVVTLLTAGANGAFIRRIRIKALGTNIANVMRVFINNGSTNATPANNVLWGELTLAASALLANAPSSPDYEYNMNLVLPPGYVVNVALGSAAAAGWVASAEGGNY